MKSFARPSELMILQRCSKCGKAATNDKKTKDWTSICRLDQLPDDPSKVRGSNYCAWLICDDCLAGGIDIRLNELLGPPEIVGKTKRGHE